MESGSERVDASGLDLDQYDLPGLRLDIQQILDLPSAVVDVLSRSAWLVFLGVMTAWTLFNSRMPRWVLVPYMVAVTTALLLAATAIGVLFVFRKRLADIDRAADRSLFTVAAMHGDLVGLQTGGGDIPLREVASFISQTVLFPMLVGSAGSMIESSATAASGPIGWLSGRLLSRAMSHVEARVLAALDAVDDTVPVSSAHLAADRVDDDTWSNLPELELPSEILGWYESAHRYLSRLVDGVEVLAVGGAGATTALATAPLISVLALGWFLT